MSTRVGSFLYRCLVEKQRSGPYPCAFFSKITFSHHLSSLLPFHFTQKNRPLRITMIPSVAGCTTGSLCPRCPHIRDEVLSLYSKPKFLSTRATLLVLVQKFRTPEHNVP